MIVSMMGSDKAVTTSTMPMPTVELCTAAKVKLQDPYKQQQALNFTIVTVRLKARQAWIASSCRAPGRVSVADMALQASRVHLPGSTLPCRG